MTMNMKIMNVSLVGSAVLCDNYMASGLQMRGHTLQAEAQRETEQQKKALRESKSLVKRLEAKSKRARKLKVTRKYKPRGAVFNDSPDEEILQTKEELQMAKATRDKLLRKEERRPEVIKSVRHWEGLRHVLPGKIELAYLTDKEKQEYLNRMQGLRRTTSGVRPEVGGLIDEAILKGKIRAVAQQYLKESTGISVKDFFEQHKIEFPYLTLEQLERAVGTEEDREEDREFAQTMMAELNAEQLKAEKPLKTLKRQNVLRRSRQEKAKKHQKELAKKRSQQEQLFRDEAGNWFRRTDLKKDGKRKSKLFVGKAKTYEAMHHAPIQRALEMLNIEEELNPYKVKPNQLKEALFRALPNVRVESIEAKHLWCFYEEVISTFKKPFFKRFWDNIGCHAEELRLKIINESTQLGQKYLWKFAKKNRVGYSRASSLIFHNSSGSMARSVYVE